METAKEAGFVISADDVKKAQAEVSDKAVVIWDSYRKMKSELQ